MIPLEAAARAACSMEMLGKFPDTNSGRAKHRAYIEDHWMGVYLQMRMKSKWDEIFGKKPGVSWRYWYGII